MWYQHRPTVSFYHVQDTERLVPDAVLAETAALPIYYCLLAILVCPMSDGLFGCH